MTEIEIKARVNDREKTEKAIRDFATFERSVVKRDVYWGGRGAGTQGFMKVRIRDEGHDAIVTYKRKELRNETEVNDEREFEVSDRAAFEALLADLSFAPYAKKDKETLAFSWITPEGTPVTIELSLVTGLGWFCELEVLEDSPSEASIARARAALWETLAKIGLAETDLEPRFYTEMLAEAGLGTLEDFHAPEK